MEGFPDARFNASAECLLFYGELTTYTLTQGDSTFMRQLAVDTYRAQHATVDGPPIGVAFALIGLYYVCEHGYTGRQVQHMHRLLAQRSKTWPRFVPPSHMGAVTVVDVVRARPGAERDDLLRQWCRAVWNAWRPEHERVKELIASVMAD
jgi:hypothetical protein